MSTVARTIDEFGAGVRAGAVAAVQVRAWAIVVWSAMAGWSIVLFAIAYDQFLNYQYSRFDLGNMTQAVWSTTQGRPLEMTDAVTGEQVVRLAYHVDPILVLLTPIWIVLPSPLTLVGVQIAACALGALPIFWLARRHLQSEAVAALLALVYLAYPWLAWNALDAIHPVTLAIPLFLFALWFLDTDRMWAFAGCAVLAAMCGELMGIPLAGLGVWYALARGRRRQGAVIAAAGVAWTLFCVYVVVPHFADGPSVYYGHFSAVGGSPEGVGHMAILDPGAIVSSLTTDRDIAYAAVVALPVAGLFLLAPGVVAIAAPLLLVNGLGDKSSFTDPRVHYSSVVIAFLLAAVVLGFERIPARLRAYAAIFVLVLCVAATLLIGVPSAPRGAASHLTASEIASRRQALDTAIALVPHRAPVTTSNAPGSMLSARRGVFRVPVTSRSEWIIIEASLGGDERAVAYETSSEFVAGIRASPDWRLVFEETGVLVFRRVRDYSSA